MGRKVTLEIPPRNDQLVLVRRTVTTAAGKHPGLTGRRVDDLRLAVSEACSNAINAQLANGSPEPVRVVVELLDGAVSVTVTDHAGGFSPDEVEPIPSVEDPQRLRHERGLGISLMRSLSDSVTFTPTGDGTEVRLVVEAPD